MTRTKQTVRRMDPSEVGTKGSLAKPTKPKMAEKLGVGTKKPSSPIKKATIVLTVGPKVTAERALREKDKKKKTDDGKEEGEGEKKKKKVNPTQRSNRTIKKMQKGNKLIFSKAPMLRLIRRILDEKVGKQFGRAPGHYRMEGLAKDLLRQAGEQFLLTNMLQIPAKLGEIMTGRPGNCTFEAFGAYALTNSDVQRALGPTYIQEMEKKLEKNAWERKIKKKTKEVDRKKEANDARLVIYRKKEDNKMKREIKKEKEKDKEVERERKEKVDEPKKNASKKVSAKRKEMDEDPRKDERKKKVTYERVKKPTKDDEKKRDREKDKKKERRDHGKREDDDSDSETYSRKSAKRSTDKGRKSVKRSKRRIYQSSSDSESSP